MNESDLWDLLPTERPLPGRSRRAIRDALMAQADDDLPRSEEAAGVVTVALAPAKPERRRRISARIRVAAVAAVAIAVAGATGAIAVADRTGPPSARDGDRPPSEDRPVDVVAGFASSSSALADSGKVVCSYRKHIPGPDLSDTTVHTFSGDDRSMAIHSELTFAPPFDYSTESRLVDGELYERLILDPADPVVRWYHLTDMELFPGPDGSIGETPFGLGPGVDPATLFDELAQLGPFEDAGEETPDGVPVRRFRAAHPERLMVLCNGTDFDPNSVTTLDVWLDDDSLVHRVEGAWQRDGATAAEREVGGTFSVDFSGYDEPVVVEAPPDAIDITIADLGR